MCTPCANILTHLGYRYARCEEPNQLTGVQLHLFRRKARRFSLDGDEWRRIFRKDTEAGLREREDSVAEKWDGKREHDPANAKRKA